MDRECALALSIYYSLHRAAQRLTADEIGPPHKPITQLYYFVILKIVGTHHQLFFRFESILLGPR